jgi:hypothetical protein
MAHNGARSAPEGAPVPCPVVLASARWVVGSDDSGRFAARGETVRTNIQDSPDLTPAQRGGAPGDAPGEASYKARDVVETALARALMLAAEAARWELVAQIAKELEERRCLRECSRPSACEHVPKCKVAERSPLTDLMSTRALPPPIGWYVETCASNTDAASRFY